MRQFRRQLLVGGLGIIAALGALTSSGSGAAPGCDLSNLQLRSSTVNQGLPYDRLVRGKETLVRLYLSLPSCAGTTSSIQITGGTLTATGAGATLASGITGTPTPVNVFPSVATYSTAALNDAPADIKFVVPGAALAPASTMAEFTATFRANLTFQYKTSSNTTPPVAGTKTFDNFASKTVEKKTNALRILVVPMGNSANPYSTEFPAVAVASVENGMQTLSRIFPVPSGVGTLGSNTGGIRYAIDPTLLNVGATSPGWCGDGGNFNLIKAQLAQFLVSWNTANPTAQADRVVGAISSDKSQGGSAGCAEGMASLVSPEAWVRAFPDLAAAPSMTGALFAMEIAHTFGLVPSSRSFSTFHSLNTAADGTDPNRGFNVALRSFLSDDHSATKLAGTWNNNTTILEKADYAFLLCVLGGVTNTECTTPTVAGSATGVAALATAYALTGHTDGTAANTMAQESYVASALEGRGTDASSDYKLVQLAANNSILQSTGVRVALDEAIHKLPGSPDQEPATLGTFAVVTGLNISAQKFELRKGANVLWSARKTNPPVITSFTTAAGGARNFTNTPIQREDEPALTTDAKWVAYTAGAGVTVAPVGAVQSGVSIPFPVQNGSNGAVVYSETNQIHVVVDPTGATPSDIVRFNGGSAVSGIQDPEWSPDLTRIVFSAVNPAGNRDIYTVNAFGGTARRLTTHADYDTKPTWSPKGRIVFVRGPIGGGPTTELYSVRPDGTGETRLTTDAFNDDEPTASPDGNQIAWQRADAGGAYEIYRMPANGGAMTNVTASFIPNALRPDWSPNGTELAFDGRLASDPFDIYRVGFSDGAPTPFNVTSTTGKSETNAEWAGDGSAILYSTGSGFETINFPFEGSPFVTPLSIAGASDWAVVRPSLAWPAWGGAAGDGAHLAFTSEGDLYVVDVNLSGAAPVFGDPRRLYNGGDARQSTISEDDSAAVFVVASSTGDVTYSDLFLTDLQTVDNPNPSYLTDGGGPYRNPSLSHGGTGGDVLAVEIPNTDNTPEIFSKSILLRDPSANFVPTDRIISGGSQPSWGTDGRLAFTRNGDVWAWTPPFLAESPGTEAMVFANGTAPSLAGTTYAFSRGVGGGEFPNPDIFIGSPGRGITVDVGITDDNPEDNRLDLLVQCPGLTYLGAVALLPGTSDFATASWSANFDPSLTCENPTIRVAVSDGYNRVLSGGTPQTIENAQKNPTAASYTPSPGSSLREYDVVPARGGGWDAENGTLPDANLGWRLDGPGGFLQTDNGHSVVDFSPPATGFPLGAYTLTLTVSDSAGNMDSATRTFTIVEDADNDGLTVDEERGACVTRDPFYASNDLDPMNAFRDDDGDGIPNVDDAAICTAATSYEAIVDIDADMIKAQTTGVITGFVTLRYRPITAVNGATVRISSINGIPANIPSLRWSVDTNGVGVSKFDKAAVIGFMNAHQIGNGYALITITGGSSAGWTFEGSDLTLVH